jgi:hypothetical protein
MFLLVEHVINMAGRKHVSDSFVKSTVVKARSSLIGGSANLFTFVDYRYAYLARATDKLLRLQITSRAQPHACPVDISSLLHDHMLAPTTTRNKPLNSTQETRAGTISP